MLRHSSLHLTFINLYESCMYAHISKSTNRYRSQTDMAKEGGRHNYYNDGYIY